MTHPYARPNYAASLAHVGEALAIPEWDTPVLARPTPDGRRRDAIGAYPVAALGPDADLAGGLRRVATAGLVSVVLVLDERLRPPLGALEAAFDFVRPFKIHYLHDRRVGPLELGKHHRYELRRALARVEAREIVLAEHLPAWEALYGELAVRHGLSGLHAFPPGHHLALARMPGLRSFGAFLDGRLVSAHLFVTHEGYAISHLAASAPEGYASGAAYAINDRAIAELADCEVINFGGGAGAVEDASDGLVRFKKGFCNATAQAYLGGATLDPSAYRKMSAGREDNGYFPAYRGPRVQEPADAHQG